MRESCWVVLTFESVDEILRCEYRIQIKPLLNLSASERIICFSVFITEWNLEILQISTLNTIWKWKCQGPGIFLAIFCLCNTYVSQRLGSRIKFDPCKVYFLRTIKPRQRHHGITLLISIVIKIFCIRTLCAWVFFSTLLPWEFIYAKLRILRF